MHTIFFYRSRDGKRPVADYIRELAEKKDKDSRIKLHKIQDYIKAPPHKDRLTPLHAICLHIFRHFRQKNLDIRQYACGFFGNLTKNLTAHLTHNLCAVAP